MYYKNNFATLNYGNDYLPVYKTWSPLLKLGSHLQKKNFFICFNDSPSIMMKNAFYFVSKALFDLKLFNFLSWHFGHVEKRLD